MSETRISLEEIHPIALLGIHNQNLKLLQAAFPKLKIVARGNELLIKGDVAESARLTEKVEEIIHHIERFDSLTPDKLRDILGGIAPPFEAIPEDAERGEP